MEDVYQMIDHVTRIEEQNRAFFRPNFEPVQPSLQVNGVNLGKATWYHQAHDQSHNGHFHQVQFSNNFRDNKRQQRGPLQKGQGQPQYKNGPKKMTRYYCMGECKIKDCIKLTKERAEDKERDTDVIKQYKNKLWDAVQKGSIKINEALFTRMPEMTYSMEQTEQLLGNL